MKCFKTSLTLFAIGLMTVFAAAAVLASPFEPKGESDDKSDETLAETALMDVPDPAAAVEKLAVPVTGMGSHGSHSFLSLGGVYSGPWSEAIMEAAPMAGASPRQDIVTIVNDRESVAEPFSAGQTLPDIKTELQLMMTPEDLKELSPSPPETASAKESESAPSGLTLQVPVAEPLTGGGVSGFDVSAAPDQVDRVGGGGGSSTGGIIFAIVFVVVLAVGFMVRMMAGSSF